MFAAMPTQTQQYVYGQQPETPPVTPGRLRQDGVSESHRNIAVLMHLSYPIAYFFLSMGPLALLVPLGIWFIYRSQSEFIQDHGKDGVNFGISMLLYHILFFLLPIIWIVMIVNAIRAAKAAHRGEYFRYPITIRFLS